MPKQAKALVITIGNKESYGKVQGLDFSLSVD